MAVTVTHTCDLRLHLVSVHTYYIWKLSVLSTPPGPKVLSK